MSEKETKSGSKAGGSEVVVVDQVPPYRPPEAEESSPPRRQRLRTPPASTVTGKKKKESSHTTSTPRKVSKSSETPLSEDEIEKITSATSKKSASPNETIAMASLEAESTKHPDTASLTSRSTKPAAPIPPDVSSKTSVPSPALPAKPIDDASTGDVTIESDDVAELRTVLDTETKHSEWNTYGGGVSDHMLSSSRSAKKKEISWDSDEYLLNIQLQEMGIASRTVPLERTASVGPYRSKTPFAIPSGVMICVPKKSVRNMKDDFNNVAPGINISISKKCLAKKSKSGVVIRNSSGDFKHEAERRAVKGCWKIVDYTTSEKKGNLIRGTKLDPESSEGEAK